MPLAHQKYYLANHSGTFFYADVISPVLGSKEKIMVQIFKKMVFPNPKFRIVCRHSKFVPQEFFGIWKVGIYADIAREFNYSEYFPYQFEHENIAEAELIIEKRKRQFKNKNFIVREYREA